MMEKNGISLEKSAAKPALEELEIGYFLNLVPRYWKSIVLVILIGMGLTTGFYAIQDEIYEAKIILVPSKAETPSVGGLLGLASLSKEGSGDMDFFFGLLKTEPVVKRLFSSRIPDSLGKDSVSVRTVLEMDSLGPKQTYVKVQSFQKGIKIESQDGGLYQITLQSSSRWLSVALLNALVQSAFREYHDAQRFRIQSLLERLKVAIDSAGSEREEANRRLVQYKERNFGVERPQSLATMNDLTLEYRVKEEKYLLVKKEMEMANLELVKSLPPITILGPADSPPWRISPRRKVIFPVGFILSAILGYFLAFSRDILKSRKK